MRWFLWWLRGWLWRRWYFGTYLRSANWAATRKAALKRDGYRCQDCGARRALQVHHRSYARLGKEQAGDLVTLCRYCHERRHGRLWWQIATRAVAIPWVWLVFLLVLLSLVRCSLTSSP